MIHKEGLRQLDLFSPEKRRLKEDLITVFNYIRRGDRGDRTRLFLEMHSEKLKGTHHKLYQGKC